MTLCAATLGPQNTSTWPPSPRKTCDVTKQWRVRKPCVDGIITRYEGFDAEGERVIPLFGVRKPGIPERDDWRALPETATTLIG
ncbi:hypothetical protein AB4Z35_25360 [Pseudomonas sp. KB_15]|uniref:hypothetical protein n=1 Tax=Pseudomonas sp. KB_15 TaxID=3233035 RepID=UPI003F94A618